MADGYFAPMIQACPLGSGAGREVVPFTIETTAPLPGKPIPMQWEMICSEALAIVNRGSRRMGKTVGLVKRTCKLSWELPGRRTLYIHHTLGNAKKQFFDPPGIDACKGILGTLDAHGIRHSDNNTDVNTELENGSFIQVVGCNDMRQVGRKLGYHWDEVIIDEAQEHNDETLRELVTKVLAPTLIDTHGTLLIAGTPPKVHDGFWWEVINSDKYEQFTWTMLDNPLISRDAIIDEMGNAGFSVDFDNPENNHPIVQREVFGLCAIDTNALVYEYQEGRNDIPASGIPEADAKTWRHALGVDIGGAKEGNDEDAIVVIGWRTDDPKHEQFERYSWKGLSDSEELVEKVMSAITTWNPVARCMATDTGGTKSIATIQKRLGDLEFTSKPSSVELSQRLTNDELRSGRMKLDPRGVVVKALKTAQKGKHEPDVAAALRYAEHGVTNYQARETKKEPETYDQYLERNIAERNRRRRQGLRGIWTGPTPGGGPWRANASR